MSITRRPVGAPAPGGGIGELDNGILDERQLQADRTDGVLSEDDEDTPGGPGPGRPWRAAFWRATRDQLLRPQTVVTLAVVAACVVFTFVQLQPSQL
ncbi:MAG: hypothetical protein ACRDZY_22450, partial [Acidimicrobiales bacterium]